MRTVGVTGATGFLGKPLVRALLARGDKVVAFTRNLEHARRVLGDEPTFVEAELEGSGAWQDRVADLDAVVHLAGEPLAAKRWDARQKQIIRDSRVESTRLLVEAIGGLATGLRPKSLICASGADYYDWVDSS